MKIYKDLYNKKEEKSNKMRYKKKMDELKIDEGIRDLIEKLWDHHYKTLFSCSGHSPHKEAYVMLKENTGDGWFEKNYLV